MNFWLFSSKDIHNIEIAKDRLLWGFPGKDAGDKLEKNWRLFLRLYNNIKPFDIAVFQLKNEGHIHAIATINYTYYDDQIPVWKGEQNGEVLFPWRVKFSSFIFSEEAITTHFIPISDYIDGYGLGLLNCNDFRNILKKINEELRGFEINLG